MAFNATWEPGPEAVAGMRTLGMVFDQVALVIYLDPDSLAITPPRDKAEWPKFARLMRELRDGADELADFLDPNGDSGRTREPLVSHEDFSESRG